MHTYNGRFNVLTLDICDHILENNNNNYNFFGIFINFPVKEIH